MLHAHLMLYTSKIAFQVSFYVQNSANFSKSVHWIWVGLTKALLNTARTICFDFELGIPFRSPLKVVGKTQAKGNTITTHAAASPSEIPVALL